MMMSEEENTEIQVEETPEEEAPKRARKKAPAAKPVTKPQPSQKVLRKPVVKLLSFEQWATRVGVPKHHRGGMQAFLPDADRSRSQEEWDAAFASY